MKAVITVPQGSVLSGDSPTNGRVSFTTPENGTLEIEHADLGVSDGYHTFDELYNHRITLYIALCKTQVRAYSADNSIHTYVWRSKRHSDDELCFGTGTQFILGISKKPGKQISYHIPIERWDEADFAETLDKAPEWDGHTSADVLERLKRL